jgi:pimeloyl-ACP methyl ester carboxylesterase
MTTFVLVHGAWGGGWIWSRVRSSLEAEDLAVHTPTLTGSAESQHLLSLAIGLDTHIEDITAHLEWEDLTDVVLVGHSYGGMVISGVAGRIPDRVRHLVYLDAFAPTPGQSCVDILPWLKKVYADLAAAHDGKYMTPPDPADFGVNNPVDARWIAERSTLMPHKVTGDPLPEPGMPPVAECPVTFVNCTGTRLFADTAQEARAKGWTVADLDAGHFALVTHVSETTDILLELA